MARQWRESLRPVRFRCFWIWPVLCPLLLGMGCAPLPSQQATGTPAARIARESFATLRSAEATIGAAVAVDHRHLLTNGHVVRQAAGPLRLRSADGLREVEAELVALSPRMDLAILRMPAGFLAPAAAAETGPSRGSPVWAVGPEGLGRSLAAGRVYHPAFRLSGFGSGFTAGLGALMGFSGGPVVDGRGRLLGLTTALPGSGLAPQLAMLFGVDVVGFAEGARRQVFVLGIHEALAEAGRLHPALTATSGRFLFAGGP